MALSRLLLVAALVGLGACDTGDPPPPLAAGVTATVNGRPFLFNLTMGWAAPDAGAPISISGARMDTDGMRMILLTVPGRVGTYTERDAEVSAAYTAGSPADTTFQMWLAGESADDTSLNIQVEAVDQTHAEGTFSFTARHTDRPADVVTVTGGTFNLALGPAPVRPAGTPTGAAAHARRLLSHTR